MKVPRGVIGERLNVMDIQLLGNNVNSAFVEDGRHYSTVGSSHHSTLNTVSINRGEVRKLTLISSMSPNLVPMLYHVRTLSNMILKYAIEYKQQDIKTVTYL